MSMIRTTLSRSRQRAFCLSCKEIFSGDDAEINGAKHAQERVHEVHASVLVSTIHRPGKEVETP